jgi:hypothetical protein
VGDPELEWEEGRRRGRRRFALSTFVLVGALVVSAGYVHSQVPKVTPLSAPLPGTSASAAALDDQAAATADRLAQAAGRSLQSLADQATGPVANAADTDASTVAGAATATEQQAKNLEQLNKAEQAASEKLAVTKDQLAAAEEERKKAAQERASEESAAARAIDAAIDAAILAARARSSAGLVDPSLIPTGGGTNLDGPPTNTRQVLASVRKYFPASEVGNAMAVSRCESGHANRVGRTNPNGTHDYGVFQLNDGGTLQAALRSIGEGTASTDVAHRKGLDVDTNVRAAHAIWEARGWQPWVCAAKLKITAGLYQRVPGPMSGKYDVYGRAQ